MKMIENRLPDLASPSAFAADPSLVWEFYHYRREVMSSKEPNPAHHAIAAFEKRARAEGRKCVVITQGAGFNSKNSKLAWSLA